MEITFLRLTEWSCASVAARDDGVTVRVPGYGPVLPLPHDLAHLVVEQQLRLSSGFWGSVAAGAVFPGMEVFSGRQRPHAAERSRAIIKENGDLINRAEVIVGAFTVIIQRGLDEKPGAALKLLREWQSFLSVGVIEFDAAKVTSICRELRAFATRWQATAFGDGLSLTWTVRTEPGSGSIVARRPRRSGHASPSPVRTGVRAARR